LVRADRTRLKQVMLNLMSNAVKYNTPEGTMTLACTRIAGGWLRIGVTDSGIGIPADKMEELFRPFSRLNADKSEIQGAGVGLAVTKSLVELMGGRIGVESEIDKGTTFWVELMQQGAGAEIEN
jgi:signal transduction histidine kinase